MEMKRLDTVLLKLLYLDAVLIVMFQALQQTAVTSRLFLLTFPLTVVLWFRCAWKKVTRLDLLMVGTVILAVICVLINAVAAGASLSFDYLRKTIIFATSLLYLQTAYRVRVDKEMARFINILMDLLTVFLIVIYFLRPVQVRMVNGIVSKYLAFGFASSNMTGLVLTCVYMLELYRLFTPEKWYWKIIHIIMAVFLALFVVESQARNSLLVVVLFTAACVLLVFKGKKRLRISWGWAGFVSVFPALFVAMYFGVVNNSWVQNRLSFITGVGKGLDSRTVIWSRGLEYLGQSPLFGAYGQISNKTGSFQMHNSHLDIACSYGVPVLILVCILLGCYLYQGGRRHTDKKSFIYILGFACSIMLGLGEAAVFSGGLGIYIFVGTFLLLVDREPQGERALI